VMTRLGELSAPDVWLVVVCVLLLVASAAVPLAAFAMRFTHSNYWGCHRMFADIIEQFLLPLQPLRHSAQATDQPAELPVEERARAPDFPCPHSHRATG
jgi:hypothetical protein